MKPIDKKDKVASFWCTINNVIKIQKIFTVSQLKLLCLGMTFMGCFLSLLFLWNHLSLENVCISLFTNSLSFFLFSYHGMFLSSHSLTNSPREDHSVFANSSINDKLSLHFPCQMVYSFLFLFNDSIIHQRPQCINCISLFHRFFHPALPNLLQIHFFTMCEHFLYFDYDGLYPVLSV